MSIVDSLFSKNGERVEDSIVYAENRPVGILVPSTMFGTTVQGKVAVSGPSGIAVLEESTMEELIRSLISVGSIIFGSEEEVLQVYQLLASDITSRTASYFCCISKNCSELVEAYSRINGSCVLIAGCGGVGSISAVMFAGLGVRKIKVVDPDVVEISNLNRQFFWRKRDSGRLKVDVIKEYIEERYDVVCEVSRVSISDENVEGFLNSVDGVVMSADEPINVGREKISGLASKYGIGVVFTGYSHSRAVVKFEPSSSHSESDDRVSKLRSHTPITWHRHDCFIGPSFGPMNSQVAGLGVSLISQSIGFPHIKYRMENKGGFFDWNPGFYFG